MGIIDRRAPKPRMHSLRQRRFEELPTPNPSEVRDLSQDHPAIIERRPLFESAVVKITDEDDRNEKVLLSGEHNRKIGRLITKGAWRGFPIYCLTLPERTTCPSSCYLYRSCYGNAMPFARRHLPGIDLENKIFVEVAHLADKHENGFVVRLHTLGDFYSVQYVQFWAALLEGHRNLHVYGYTARGAASDAESGAIAAAIEKVRIKFQDRWRIRWSISNPPQPRGATVIDRIPEGKVVPEGLVCPAETDAMACCATCSMCWEQPMQDKTIVFLKHGMGSKKGEVIAREATKTVSGRRQIQPIPNLTKLAGKALNEPPTLLWVKPTELTIDEAYQRNLSRASINLISRIVQGWNWTHVKPPICSKDEETDTFYVLDGQHTAIAAATHPGIDKIPIMVVDAETMKDRARAFIGHNRDRIAVTPCQLHYSSIVAGDPESVEIDRVCQEAKVTICKVPPPNGFRPGETIAISAIKTIIRIYGAAKAITALSILASARCAPVRADQMRAAAHLLYSSEYEGILSLDALIRSFRTLPYDEAAREAREIAAHSAISRWQALAVPYLRAAQIEFDEAA